MKKSYLILLLLVILVSSCSQVVETPLQVVPSKTGVVTASPSSVVITKTATLTQSPTSTQTHTTAPTLTPDLPTSTPTPEDLTMFSTNGLSYGVTPVAYMHETCTYLNYRWGEDKSSPGTIVVPIMFHSIAKPGREITDSTTISMEYFEFFMQTAKEMGFSTITMDELVGFLENNQKIPELSMILILDDRRPGVTELFMPYLEENDWTLTLAWPTTEGTNEQLWARMEALANSGRLDIQSHGHNHIYIQGYTPIEEIAEEVYRPIEVIQSHFGTTPSALIWPGGNFTGEAVRMAREAGFSLGFTVYSRGPLMFNWIPLGEAEMMINDTLMVLPRFWSTAADVALLQAVEISEMAKQEAVEVKFEELRYYALYCQSVEGE